MRHKSSRHSIDKGYFRVQLWFSIIDHISSLKSPGSLDPIQPEKNADDKVKITNDIKIDFPFILARYLHPPSRGMNKKALLFF